jgi:hypothetical protein
MDSAFNALIAVALSALKNSQTQPEITPPLVTSPENRCDTIKSLPYRTSPPMDIPRAPLKKRILSEITAERARAW